MAVLTLPQFQHKVVKAFWSEDLGKWTLTVEQHDGSRFEDSAPIVVSATGILNTWNMPDIPGIEKFNGMLYVATLFGPCFFSYVFMA